MRQSKKQKYLKKHYRRNKNKTNELVTRKLW